MVHEGGALLLIRKHRFVYESSLAHYLGAHMAGGQSRGSLPPAQNVPSSGLGAVVPASLQHAGVSGLV
jgi:hypothetical protein